MREAYYTLRFWRGRGRGRAPEAGDPRVIAWFEPAHDVLANAAGHFSRRMGRALTGRRDISLSSVQGQALRLDGRWVVPTWHPSYVLRLPGREEQGAAFDAMLVALRLARSLLDENPASV